MKKSCHFAHAHWGSIGKRYNNKGQHPASRSQSQSFAKIADSRVRVSARRRVRVRDIGRSERLRFLRSKYLIVTGQPFPRPF